MGGDHRFYYDFDQEIKLENWEVVRQEQNRAILQCHITEPEGDYLFLAPCRDNDPLWPWPSLKHFSVNGCAMPLRRNEAVYVHSDCARYGIGFRMKPGDNLLEAEIALRENSKYEQTELLFSLLRAEPPQPAPIVSRKMMHKIPVEKYRRNRDDFDAAGWKNGVGYNGADYLKLFPACLGPGYVKNLKAVIKAPILAVGGVNADNIPAFMKVCAGVGIGSALYKAGKTADQLSADAAIVAAVRSDNIKLSSHGISSYIA